MGDTKMTNINKFEGKRAFLINGKKYSVNVIRFVDKSELNSEGRYDYYYSGYHFDISCNEVKVHGTKSDTQSYIWFEHVDLSTLQKHIKDYKEILTDIFDTRYYVYWYSIDNCESVLFLWCKESIDEDAYFYKGNYKCGIHVCENRIHYSNDILRYAGRFDVDGKPSGVCKIYDRVGSLYYEGIYNEELVKL